MSEIVQNRDIVAVQIRNVLSKAPISVILSDHEIHFTCLKPFWLLLINEYDMY